MKSARWFDSAYGPVYLYSYLRLKSEAGTRITATDNDHPEATGPREGSKGTGW
jgi:hypothetical protein